MHCNSTHLLAALLLTLGVASANAAPATAQDHRGSIANFRHNAEAGDAHAQYDLGIAYMNGKGVKQDYTKAAHWLGLSARQGYAPAQTDLAGAYLVGRGVAQNQAEVVRLLHLAIAQNYAPALANLGWLYEDGLGVKANAVLAYALYAAAAKDPELTAIVGKSRDNAAKNLTSDQLTTAQDLAQSIENGHPLEAIDQYLQPKP